jgi:peptidyl-prolyl cis-trans isomerase C
MQKTLTFLGAAAFAACVALPAMAQDDANLETIVATVNGTEITLGHMVVARTTLPEQYQELPDEVLFAGILKQLIEQAALVDTFTGDLPGRVTLSLENERRSLIAGEVIERVMGTEVSDDALQAAYEAEYKDVVAGSEYNASHILVETEEEATAIVEELKDGTDFAIVAREKSTGPSGPGGGSLGWFGKGMMVPTFEQAVVDMEVGAVSAPVKTQFGWHVIKLNETRITDAPTLESVREELDLQIRQTTVQQTIEKITAEADIDQEAAQSIDPSLLKKIEWLE